MRVTTEVRVGVTTEVWAGVTTEVRVGVTIEVWVGVTTEVTSEGHHGGLGGGKCPKAAEHRNSPRVGTQCAVLSVLRQSKHFLACFDFVCTRGIG